MYRKSFDLIGVVLICALAVGLILADVDGGGLRLILALLLVCVLPGYAITAAIFPVHTPERPMQIALSLGLSLSFTALSGIVLNWTPWGLQAGPWAVWLGGIVLCAGGIALLRRRSGAEPAVAGANVALDWRQGVLFGLAVLVVGGAIVMARVGASQQTTKPFTQLWILQDDPANQNVVRLGVRSAEASLVKYRLQLKIGAVVVGDWTSVELKPGEQWESTAALPPRRSATETVEALLYRLDNPDAIYRRGVLWRSP